MRHNNLIIYFFVVILSQFIPINSSSILEASDLNTIKKIDKKVIYDATLYINKNEANKALFPKINLIYQSTLWKGSESRDEPNLGTIKKIAKSLPYTKIPYIIDIEHWHIRNVDEDTAAISIQKYILTIDTFKKARPDLKFGFYGVLPNRDYWAPVSNDPEKIQKWNKVNKRLHLLAKHVDVVCPSLYTFYRNIPGWKIYAIENIKRAREYKKPVYVFIWPQYHRSNKIIGNNFIDKTFWIEELKLTNNLADATIIWGGWDLKTRSRMLWKEQAEWWVLTKYFIKSHH